MTSYHGKSSTVKLGCYAACRQPINKTCMQIKDIWHGSSGKTGLEIRYSVFLPIFGNFSEFRLEHDAYQLSQLMHHCMRCVEVLYSGLRCQNGSTD